MKKTVLLKFDCFPVLSSTLFEEAFYSHKLKLPSWRLRKISCIVLYCSYHESQNCTFCCNKWANEHHNANYARPSGLAKYYHQYELSVLITSQLKNQTDARINAQ